MGGGSYSYTRDKAVKTSYGSYSREEVFSQRHMSEEMNISGKIRECRDSEEHPETLPIIIALDVTGSMGMVPYKLITNDFPEIMKKIMDEGIAHPQVCFLGIGDQYSDNAPIQVGQFEASDELLDKWLKTIWLEEGGGGSMEESYQLVWWFAARHTSVDHILKRNKKGILITIGDEKCHKSLSKEEIKRFFGNNSEKDIPTSEILNMARENWDVYHINLKDWSGSQKSVQDYWKQLIGDHLINTENSSGDDIADIISGIILKSAGTAWTKQQTKVEEKQTEHLR